MIVIAIFSKNEKPKIKTDEVTIKTDEVTDVTENSVKIHLSINNPDSVKIIEMGVFLRSDAKYHSTDGIIQQGKDTLSLYGLDENTIYKYNPYLITENKDTILGEENKFSTREKEINPEPEIVQDQQAQKEKERKEKGKKEKERIKREADAEINNYIRRCDGTKNEDSKISYLEHAIKVERNIRNKCDYYHSGLHSRINTLKAKYKKIIDGDDIEPVKDKAKEKYNRLNKL